MRRLLLIAALAAAPAFADDGDYAGPRGFHVQFRRLSTETAIQEFAWQGLNLVDMKQTINIAKHPTRYQEIGTLGMFTGPHPTVAQAVIGSVAFGVVHYYVTRQLENLVEDDGRYRWLQRAWQYVGGVYKGGVVFSNNQIGL